MDDFIIVGAGFAGLCTAIYFNIYGIKFSIYESQKKDFDIGGSVTIFPNGMKILREIFVADTVIERGAVIEHAKFSNHKGDLIGYYSMGKKKLYGEPTITIKRSVLHCIMLKKAFSMGIIVQFEKKLLKIRQNADYVCAEFVKDQVIKSKYLIGADGINSIVRNFVTSEKTEPTYSKQIYVGGFITDRKKVDSYKLDINTQYVSVGPESFFAYSIVDNIKQKNYSLLWYCYLHEKNRISKKKLTEYPDKNIIKRVSHLHKHWYHPIPKLINDSQKIIKTNIYDIIGIEKWSKDRVLLIGDSSHAMNPISGQGASFAMEDAQLLAILIKKDNQNMIRNFQTLEKIRSKRITPVAKKARRSTRLSSMKVNPMLQYIRNKLFGLKLRIVPEIMYNRALTYDVNNLIIK